MSIHSKMLSFSAVLVLSAATLPLSYGEAGAGSGGGTPNMTPSGNVKFSDPCSSNPCSAPDPLQPYRDIFDAGQPLKLDTLGQQKVLYENAWESPVFPAQPTYKESILYFDTTGLVPKAGIFVGYAELDTQANCRADLILANCIPISQSLIDIASPLISESGEYRSYFGKDIRYTFRISGNYLIVKSEYCSGDAWLEDGYFFVNMTRDRIKDFQ